MKLRRYCGTAIALSLGLGLAMAAVAQEPAVPAEVTAAPEAEPAPAEALTDAHGPAQPGDAAAGEAKSAVCAACHGMDGNSMVPMYPKLAGQHEAYAARQLAMFKDGTRADPVMLGMSAALSPQDMRDLGVYYATRKVTPGIADDSKREDGRSFYEIGQALYRGGDTARGIPACLSCHGPTGRGNPLSGYPSLAGQHATYTVKQLESFRSGVAWGKDDNANTVMVDVARSLSDEEIQALSSYIEGLHAAAEVAAQ
ncbi:MAG: cytochrome c4 [Ottowia sp.]|nr:MAG: cytochrome c4 [Ottowia sp.]